MRILFLFLIFSLFEQSCASSPCNSVKECESLGDNYEKAKEHKKALEAYKEACKLDSIVGCMASATIWSKAYPEQEGDASEMLKWYVDICKKGFMGGCYMTDDCE